jgi:hypothetical protein
VTFGGVFGIACGIAAGGTAGDLSAAFGIGAIGPPASAPATSVEAPSVIEGLHQA